MKTKFFTNTNLMLAYTRGLIKRGVSFTVHSDTNGWTVEW